MAQHVASGSPMLRCSSFYCLQSEVGQLEDIFFINSDLHGSWNGICSACSKVNGNLLLCNTTSLSAVSKKVFRDLLARAAMPGF